MKLLILPLIFLMIGMVSATIIIYPPLPTPTVNLTLVEGGSLLINTTYQVRVSAKSLNNYQWTNNQTSSRPSELVTITTNDTHKSIYVNWDNVTGSVVYNVYFNNVTGVFYNKRCATATTSPTTNQLYYQVNATSQCAGNTWDTFVLNNTAYNLPYNMSRETGNLAIDMKNGTNTKEIICSTLHSAGYGEYCILQDGLFILKGGIYNTGTGTGTFGMNNTIMYLIQGSYKNTNKNMDVQFGAIDLSENAINGNLIWLGGYSEFSATNTKLYNTVFNGRLMPSIYMLYPGGNGAIDLGSDDKDITIQNINDIRSIGSDTKYIGSGFLYYFTGLRERVTHTGGAGVSYYVFDPKFRDSFFSNEHHLSVGTGDPENIIYYDCDFETNGSINANNVPAINYGEDDYRNISIYNSMQIKVTDTDGNAIENANVTLENKNGDRQFSVSTYANGSMDKKDILRSIVYHNSSVAGYRNVNGIENYYPLTLTITTGSYSNYTAILSTMTEPINQVVALQPLCPAGTGTGTTTNCGNINWGYDTESSFLNSSKWAYDIKNKFGWINNE